MDLQNMDLKGGSLQISTEVIGKIARCAALEIEGVAEVSCGKQNRKGKKKNDLHWISDRHVFSHSKISFTSYSFVIVVKERD